MYRILLADDEGIMLESLKNIISSNYGNECEIHTAKTGRVVVEEAEKYPPDICFMDIQMPGLSGIQAIREIQKFNRSVAVSYTHLRAHETVCGLCNNYSL